MLALKELYDKESSLEGSNSLGNARQRDVVLGW
jgi:hypothetical protein